MHDTDPRTMRAAVHAGGGDGLEKPDLSLGFIPLTDCAPLVVAKEKGYFARYGLNVRLSKETSWANIRDKVAIGVLDGAQMLAPMPIASTLGLGPIHKPMVTALSLDLNGNAVTVSQGLYRRMLELDPEGMAERPVTARGLRRVIEDRRRRGEAPLTFAMVFPVSTHNYELRYWMAAAGIDPDRDLRLVVVPPSQMAGSLKAGGIDGCCVGEPWNGVAVREGVGRVLITGYEIWNNNPEKVFGVNLEWAEQHPGTHRALVGALLEAARWLDAPENRPEVVELIARGVYVNAPADVVRMSMTGTFQYARTEFPRSLPDFNVFHRYCANFPWRSHAVWLMTQMLRWGQIDRPLDLRETAERVYRSDLYRAAAGDLGIPVPAVDHKSEGGRAGAWTLGGAQDPIAMGADLFLDGGRFSPADPMAYLDGFAVARVSVDRAALGAANPPWSIEQRSAALAPEGVARTGTT